MFIRIPEINNHKKIYSIKLIFNGDPIKNISFLYNEFNSNNKIKYLSSFLSKTISILPNITIVSDIEFPYPIYYDDWLNDTKKDMKTNETFNTGGIIWDYAEECWKISVLTYYYNKKQSSSNIEISLQDLLYTLIVWENDPFFLENHSPSLGTSDWKTLFFNTQYIKLIELRDKILNKKIISPLYFNIDTINEIINKKQYTLFENIIKKSNDNNQIII